MLEKLQGEKNKNAAPRHLLWTRWRVLKRIDYLPRFHGILWSSMLRYGYNPFLRPGEQFHDTKILPVTVQSGEPVYPPGSRLTLGLSVPESELARLAVVLASIANAPGPHGHLTPGITICLESITCGLQKKGWPLHVSAPFTREAGNKAIASLCKASAFQLQFKAPLRLKRPSGCKTSYAVYCDPDWYADDPFALAHLLDQIAPGASPKIGSLRLIKVTGEWLSLPYGDGKVTPLGGFIGTLWLEGRIGPEFAWRLIRGQYTGIGKNRAFGFGLYHIPEIAAWLPLANASALTKPRPRIIVGTAPAGQKMIGLSA